MSEIGYSAQCLGVIHVVPGLHAKYGGPSYSVPRLCEALGGQGIDVTLLSVAEPGVQQNSADGKSFRDSRFAWDCTGFPVLKEMRKSRGLTRALREAVRRADLVHSHGLWLLPNIQSGRIAARARRPYLVSPRGMLSSAALRFSSVKKRLVWAACQRAVMQNAACLHATSGEEYEDIRGMSLAAPVAVIPNGVDVPKPAEAFKHDSRDRIALSLGRIHPKKGLDHLVRAWAQLENRHAAWRLRIIGPDEAGHAKELEELARRLGVARLSIEPAVYGADRLSAYQDSDLFILPTMNENFGLTAAEALAAGIPVICTKGAPWQGLETWRCGWWIDHGVQPLEFALEQAMSLPRDELGAMGTRGRAWVQRDFSWDKIGQDMQSVYEWILGKAERPSMVRLD